jgi:hypothetical protein
MPLLADATPRSFLYQICYYAQGSVLQDCLKLCTRLAIQNQRETICPWLQTSGHISWISYFLYNEVDEVEQSYRHNGEFCNYLIACVSKVCTLCTALKAKLLFGEVLQGVYVVFNFFYYKELEESSLLHARIGIGDPLLLLKFCRVIRDFQSHAQELLTQTLRSLVVWPRSSHQGQIFVFSNFHCI